MGEKLMSLQCLDHRHDAVMSPYAKIVPLCHVMGEYHAGAGPDPGQHRQQYAPLQRLGLVDDHEGVVQTPAPDVGQRQYLEHPARQDLLAYVVVDQRPEGVEDRLGPGRHLLRLRPGQVAQVLPADRVQRPEHDHLLVLAPLHRLLQAGAQGQRGLAGTGAPAERDDPDRVVPAPALTRSGMSLLIRMTSLPSAASARATDRIRLSLESLRKPGGSTAGSAWLSSTRRVPPASLTGTGSSSRPLATRSSSSSRRHWRAK